LKTRIAFQGAKGAYSEIAMGICTRGMEIQTVPCTTFQDVFETLVQGGCEYGIVALENALTGSIHENFDHFLKYPSVTIACEYQLRIRHSLITVPGATAEDVKQVLSHPQGLAQCTTWLSRYPAWKAVQFYDTAGAVEHIAATGDKSLAAIASSFAAKTYGMSVFAEGIETNARNYTRFAVLQRNDLPFPAGTVPVFTGAPVKASLVFGLADKPGSLLTALQRFAFRAMNMTKIESRPIHGKPFEYMFYVDLQASGKEADLPVVIEELQPFVTDVRMLGVYPVASDD